jgi:hypothetical protein
MPLGKELAMKKPTDKIRLYREVRTAFYALCAVMFPDDERQLRGMSQQLYDACESATAGLSIEMARLEGQIGTDNL